MEYTVYQRKAIKDPPGLMTMFGRFEDVQIDTVGSVLEFTQKYGTDYVTHRGGYTLRDSSGVVVSDKTIWEAIRTDPSAYLEGFQLLMNGSIKLN
jgi:hypothetical protein